MTHDDLILNNMNLVHSVVNRFFPTYRGNEDIVEEGMLGLVKAANAFDEDSTVAFSTYAFCAIRNEIISYLRRERKYDDLLSLDEPIGDDGEGGEVTLGDTLASTDTIGIYSCSDELDSVFSELSERDKLIVISKLRGLSVKEIAKKVKTGEANVYKVLRNVYRKMKTAIGEVK